MQQGGVSVNDEKVAAIETTFGCEQFTGDGVVIKKGKKVFDKGVLVYAVGCICNYCHRFLEKPRYDRGFSLCKGTFPGKNVA